MTQRPSTVIYEPSETGAGYVAAAFSPDGKLQARRSCETRAAAEAFLQAFMQENAGEYGLVNTPQPAAAAESDQADLRERRAGVIKSAKDEAKRRHLGIHGK
jgi:hypothetical protein